MQFSLLCFVIKKAVESDSLCKKAVESDLLCKKAVELNLLQDANIG